MYMLLITKPIVSTDGVPLPIPIDTLRNKGGKIGTAPQQRVRLHGSIRRRPIRSRQEKSTAAEDVFTQETLRANSGTTRGPQATAPHNYMQMTHEWRSIETLFTIPTGSYYDKSPKCCKTQQTSRGAMPVLPSLWPLVPVPDHLAVPRCESAKRKKNSGANEPGGRVKKRFSHTLERVGSHQTMGHLTSHRRRVRKPGTFPAT